MVEKPKLEELRDATIVGYSWTGNIRALQIKLKDGRLFFIVPKASDRTDKRRKPEGWLEIATEDEYYHPWKSKIREEKGEKEVETKT